MVRKQAGESVEHLDPELKENVRLLGEVLGQIIATDKGDEFVDTIEKIRTLAKRARAGAQNQELIDTLKGLSDDDIIPITRAFNQFLNLANIAEQYHDVVRRRRNEGEAFLEHLEELIQRLKEGKESINVLEQIRSMQVELVLTAHPTEVTRRTLIQKYDQILHALDKAETLPFPHERQFILERLTELVGEVWYTDEIRQQRPTPEDEAKWGFATIENSLWDAVPRFYKELDKLLLDYEGERLPIECAPIKFCSWMGGDRDGNPNVTAKVTERVLLLGRWMAADLYLRDLRELVNDLSMSQCNETLRAVIGDVREPYRHLLHELRQRLKATRAWAEALLQGETPNAFNKPLLDTQSLIEPLKLCYQSLLDCNMEVVANGRLLDTLRRAYTFGLSLTQLDIRQESGRHAQVFAELTQFLDMGDYGSWDESQRQAFLLKELQNKRPLLPLNWQPSPEVEEVLATCKVVAKETPNALGAYVISMASKPSDVLAVALLLKMVGKTEPMPIAPLFETLDDLNGAADSINALLNVPWYKTYCRGRQMVMVGYSDSAKDAGQMAATWAQYRAQESLVKVADQHNVGLMLFHGRGGTVGRGGGPAHGAILSQPPGSVQGKLRVTEQGEMIRFKFGNPDVALRSLQVYLSAVLEATLLPPPEPKPEWRTTLDQLCDQAVKSYRKVVRETPEFVPYFRAVTPEQELGKLALGSRPAKRKSDGGVESLRAIPWIFAWMQIRLMLPAWLGGDEALANKIEQGGLEELQTMREQWPFFQTFTDMLEMVLCKTDSGIAEYYERRLSNSENDRALGSLLRDRLAKAISTINQIKGQSELLQHTPVIKESMAVRNPYTDPLHYLQAELLLRSRLQGEKVNHKADHALKVTMAGIAAGMRNTG